MDSLEQFLSSEGREKFQDAVKLSDIEAQNDPENEPYKSKYKAREIWHELKNKIDEILEEAQPQSSALQDKLPLVVLMLKLGVNYYETDEESTGEEYLAKCINILEDNRLDAVACNALQHAYNQMGILWAGRRRPERALKFLQNAELLYKDFKKDVGSAPVSIEEFFALKDEDGGDEGTVAHRRASNFEDAYTHTLYYLAQVYGKLEEIKKSSEYCHVTLCRQLETKKYNAIEWSLNAAMLSQYYMTQGDFTLSRHCLASSSVILTEAGEPVTKCEYIQGETETVASERERMPRSWSDLYRCWAKYGLALLETSWAEAMEAVDRMDEEEEDHNADKKEDKADDKTTVNSNEAGQDTEGASSFSVSDTTDPDSKDSKKLRFDLELTSAEGQITDAYVKDFEQARAVFLCVQRWLNAAKEFYVLDGHCTDYVEIVQDLSRLFKVLAYFELDFDRQCKMHKRRVDMLLAVATELNPQHYLLIYRQLIYEVAETYSAILDIKLSIIEERGTAPSAHAVNKINTLTQQSIDQFKVYIDTLKTSSKKLPDKFSEEDERPALIAYFCMGRLYSKFLHFELGQRLANIKLSMEHYKFLVDYCKENPAAADKVKSERDICEEMVTLLPLKMDKMRAQAERN